MDFKETEWKVAEWIHVAQDRDQWRSHVNMVMKLRVPAPSSTGVSFSPTFHSTVGT
jgi:hypothetical protein